jgi:pyridoxine 5-phosphate synthase
MIRLGVNIDHVATLRQARRAAEPEPVVAAALAILGGADGITIHLREDRRHIQDRDLRLLRQTIPQRLNLELAAVDEIIALACQVRPDEATLVVIANREVVARAVRRLADAGLQVSLFIDPDLAQVEAARELGAHAIELQTASYSEAKTPEAVARTLEALRVAAAHAQRLGLSVHAGHGLNYQNVYAVAQIPQMQELNIGHSIVSRAVLVGMERAVREMKEAMLAARRSG